MVDALPEDPADYPDLRVGDQGIKRKRWYVEGYERFDDAGELRALRPQGPGGAHPHPRLGRGGRRRAGAPTSTCWTPSWRGAGSRRAPSGSTRCAREYVIDPPLGEWERAHRIGSPEERTAHLHMVTYGPDLNLSGRRPGRAADRRRPQAHPLQPVARAAVVLLPVPRRGAVGRAVGAHPPAHGRAACRAGVPRPGRRAGRLRPVAHPARAAARRDRQAGVQGVRRDRRPRLSTASCSACSPAWSSTTRCPAVARPRTRRRTGTSPRSASPTTRCTRAPARCSPPPSARWPTAPPTWPGWRRCGTRWARRECAATAMLAAHAAGATVAEVIAGRRARTAQLARSHGLPPRLRTAAGGRPTCRSAPRPGSCPRAPRRRRRGPRPAGSRRGRRTA